MNRKEILKTLKDELDSKRYEHTIGVAITASCLAMKWEYDIDEAYLAGLLHDCAKGMTDKERLSYCKKNAIEVSDVEHDNPSLLHAKVGAHLCKEKYDIDNENICNAIKWHTTGHPDMNLLEEIIFIADYIEPNRNHDLELKEIRKEAFEDLHRSTYHIYKNTLKYLENSAKRLDPMTNEAYLYYAAKI